MATLYMVIERFKGGDAVPVYRRFRERGRLAPQGLTYVASGVDARLERCFQLMETEDRPLLDDWIARWSDIVGCFRGGLSGHHLRGSSRENGPSAVA
jgi:hypothetical protein